MKIDEDLQKMSDAELRAEIMKLRTAFRVELGHTGNHRCWINLLEVLPEGKSIKPLTLPREEFIKNCCRYYDRNQK
jgi:hypothetical protein